MAPSLNGSDCCSQKLTQTKEDVKAHKSWLPKSKMASTDRAERQATYKPVRRVLKPCVSSLKIAEQKHKTVCFKSNDSAV